MSIVHNQRSFKTCPYVSAQFLEKYLLASANIIVLKTTATTIFEADICLIEDFLLPNRLANS